MYNIIYYLTCLLFINPDNQNSYVNKYYSVAYICEIVYGVPTSIQLSQAIQESGGGKSNISINSNNHFGIKYYKTEYNGEFYIDRKGIKWRSYKTVIESYIDHAKFLNKHYKNLCFKGYKAWSKAKGYGEMNYWPQIIRIIEKRNYNKLDIYEN